MPLLKHSTSSAMAANQEQLDKHHGKGASRFSRILPLGFFHRPHESDLHEASEVLQVYEARAISSPTRDDDEQSPRDEDVGCDYEISEKYEAVPNGHDDQEGAGMISLLNQAPIMSSPRSDQGTITEQDASTKESPQAKNEDIKKRSGMLATFLSSRENKKVSTSLKDSQDMKDRSKATTKSSILWRIKPSWTKKDNSSKSLLPEEPKENEVTNVEDDCPEISLIHGDAATTSFLVIRPTTSENLSLDQVSDDENDYDDDDEEEDADERDPGNDKLINLARTQRGLKPLRSSNYLNSLAKSHAVAMAQHGMLGHSVENMIELQLQLHSMDVGENIQSGSSMKHMHAIAMKQGTSNRKNILRESYLEYGYGSARSEDDGKLYQVQLFRGKPIMLERKGAAVKDDYFFRQGEGVNCCVCYRY